MSDTENASALFQELSQRARPSALVDIPPRAPGEKPKQVRLIILAQSEIVRCTASAQKVASEACKEGDRDTRDHSNEEGWREIFREEKMIQILAKSMRVPGFKDDDPLGMFVPSAKYLRDWFTSDELAVLIQSYANLRADAGPMLSACSEAEADAWIGVLMEGGSRLPLSRMSSEGMTDLVMHIVARLKTCLTRSSSVGQPVESSISEISSNETGKDLL